MLENHVHSLEQQMVKEFRVLQRLVEITKEERTALDDPFVSNLMSIVEEKESTIDELVRLEDAFRMCVDQCAQDLEISSPDVKLEHLLPHFDSSTVAKFDQLQNGIMMMLAELKSQTAKNMALANIGLERSQSLQSFLIDLLNNNVENGLPPEYSHAETIGWELDQKV